jgi:FtsP/CotA-like multicopper oxidase with cupredoxin domain
MAKNISRRHMLRLIAATAGGVAALTGGVHARTTENPGRSQPAAGAQHPQMPPGEPGKDYTPVVTPNGWTLPYKVIDGVKVFHLIAEPVQNAFAPGLVGECWGYNGTTPGPTIEVVEGDRVRIYVSNRLPEPTSVHWHGILLPNGMDGLAGLTQKPIAPGRTFKYEFTLRQHGTHMYHPHFDEMIQMAMGMQGLFIIHPRHPKRRPDRDFAIMLNEWRIDPGTSRPNPNEMVEFNVFTMNSKAFPGTAPLVAGLGDRVKIRLANLSAMDHHPIHLHGYQFHITETDGGQIPESAQQVETTVLVPVGSTRAFEFVADEPGDWAMHCHMTHHVMNQMGHEFPNMIGVQPGNLDEKVRSLLPTYMTMGHTGMGEMAMMAMPVPQNSIPMKGGQGPFGPIDMGGMFTILKVRKDLASYDDPGWYVHPQGTVADTTSSSDLRRDGIAVPSAAATPTPSEMQKGGHHQH